jgi:GT2 family glycosyltransferase
MSTPASSPQPLKIAVGIATKGRPELLRDTLVRLTEQRRPADRVVLCPASAKDLPASLPLDCQVVSAPVGLPAQRNAILDVLGDCDVVVFFDDDFFPCANYLAEIEALFRQHPGLAVVRGTLIADGIHGTGFDTEEALALIAADRPPAQVQVQTTYGAYGCNFAARLSLVRAHGARFDEALPLYGWQEDIDFSRQLAPYGEVLIASGLRGVHLGNKGGRTSGLRFGYSQVANPIYLVRKGTMSLDYARRLMWRNLASNLARSAWPEDHVDRRGRLRGNLWALADWLRGRAHPGRILEIGP